MRDLYRLLLIASVSVVSLTAPVQENKDVALNMTIVHFNDFHARFDEQSPTSGVCKPTDTCHGGFARMYQAIMDAMADAPNPILLNAGDSFQGTLWHTLFKWNATQHFMNLLPLTAYTIGNHEFDDGIAGLAPFLSAMRLPALVCNMDDSNEPAMRGLYRKSMVVVVGGKRIGIVGVAISSGGTDVGGLKFRDESKSVNEEVDRLITEEDVFSVIVLSHAGYDKDQEIARNAGKKVSIVVGGHTHTFLNSGVGEDGSKPAGPYPTVVARDVDGKGVPVVQASAYTKYLGKLWLALDEEGDAAGYGGKAIHLAKTIPQNPEMVEELQPWKDIVDGIGNKVYGSTEVVLEQKSCYNTECNLGNLVADSMVHAYRDSATWGNTPLAMINSAGLRSAINIGNITYNDLIVALPFGNTVDIGIIQGRYIKDVFENTISSYTVGDEPLIGYHLLQIAGFEVTYDLSKPANERIVGLEVLNTEGPTPVMEPLDADKDYRLIVVSYLGTSNWIISRNMRNYTQGPVDVDVMMDFLPAVSPINIGFEGRIVFVDD